MTAEEMIRLASINVEAWSVGDWERLKAPLSPDLICTEFGTQRILHGVDQFVDMYKTWKQMAPDGVGKIVNSLVSGNTVVLEVLWSGAQSGPLPTPGGVIPASGKPFSIPACQVVIFKDDKIVELRHYFDLTTLLQAIGAAPKLEIKEEVLPGI